MTDVRKGHAPGLPTREQFGERFRQASSALKLMIDRLVCADGGNPDPTSTSGKDAAKAKALGLAGWPYPKHLAGRAYGVVVHGDVEGVEPVRRALCDWLDWMGLIDAGFLARLDRYIGYYCAPESSRTPTPASSRLVRNRVIPFR